MSVNCPKCGRQNPDEAYICQFCDSPLVTYTPPQIPSEEPPEENDENSPEWLEHLRRKKEEDAQKLGGDFFNRFGPVDLKPVNSPTGEEEGLDDWLSKVRTNKEADPDAVSPLNGMTENLPEESSTSDWLSAIRQKAENEGIIQPESTPLPQEGDDWLSKLRKQTDNLKTPVEENPVWMEELNAPQMSPPPFEGIIPSPEDLADTYIDDEAEPEFLQHLNELPELPEFPVGPESYTHYASPVTEEPEHPIPEQLRNSISQADAQAFAEEVLPSEEQLLEMQDEPRERIPSKDIPNWLTSILGENEAEAAPLSAITAAPEQADTQEVPSIPVEPGNIPGWVQAMRPLESVNQPSEIQPQFDRIIEDNGPLAGIRGILPGEGLAPTYNTTSTGFDISIGDKKKTAEHVSLFNEILATETQSVKVPAYQKTRTAGTIRWLIMLLLFSIIALPIISGTKASALPNSIPKETINLFKSITALPADSKVLVAIDYEPAYAGELQAAASSVLNHLMVKQSNLYLVSTSPTGPAMARQLITSMALYPQSFQAAYTSGEKYHILGFLPGGQAGILALNQSVTNAIPLTLDLTKTTDLQGLSGPSPLSSFDAVLIISDQPDTIRYWLEQVKQENGKPAIWAVANAQSAPLLRPYIRSGQLEGLSAGEYGGTLYERIFQQPGMAWRHWNVFYTGLLAAVVLILLGGILNYSGQLILRNRRKKTV